VPPTMRGMKAGERAPAGMGMGMRDESNTVRVSNLSDETREDDLRELVRPFGPVSRVYLVKHKNTGQSRGFAYITFQRRDDGQRAIDRLNGHGYDHLVCVCVCRSLRGYVRVSSIRM
jgi:translation initiation factor 3 subunit G